MLSREIRLRFITIRIIPDVIITMHFTEAALSLGCFFHHHQRVLREVRLLWHESHPLHVLQDETEILRGLCHGTFDLISVKLVASFALYHSVTS
jgi:hypothetical protein